jgi:hypothetical protein
MTDEDEKPMSSARDLIITKLNAMPDGPRRRKLELELWRILKAPAAAG